MTDAEAPSGPLPPNAEKAERIERRWATLSACIVALLIVMAAFAGIHQATMPQPTIETVDPRTLNTSGEFIESNLGSALEADGSVTIRVVGQQYSFTPDCLLAPTDTPINIRATSLDVVHGFVIDGTNVNTMLVPGYVSIIPTRFAASGDRLMPCHEYCGTGHEGMWAHVQIIAKQDFLRLAQRTKRLTCVK